VLAILADIIDQYLLQPTYQIPEERTFRDFLYQLAPVDPKRERILRGMLLAALQSEREKAEDDLINQAIRELMKVHGVDDIITPGSIDDFEGRLEDILGDVLQTWRAVQYSTQFFTSEFEYVHVNGFDWKYVDFPGTNASQGSKHEDDDDVFVLFPRVYLMGENERPITAGAVVRNSHIRAMFKQERGNAPSSGQGLPRPRQRPGRAPSMSSDTRNGQTRRAFLSRATESVKP
jgi:hypothetical protein